MESVIGNGNCLFQSLSFFLCGDQGMHTKAREEIVHFIKENKHKFQPYLMQGTTVKRETLVGETLPNSLQKYSLQNKLWQI